MKTIAIRILCSMHDPRTAVSESEIERLKSHAVRIGEYEEEMGLEEMACLVILHEIEREKTRNQG